MGGWGILIVFQLILLHFSGLPFLQASRGTALGSLLSQMRWKQYTVLVLQKTGGHVASHISAVIYAACLAWSSCFGKETCTVKVRVWGKVPMWPSMTSLRTFLLIAPVSSQQLPKSTLPLTMTV